MAVLKTILIVALILICVIVTAIVLLQEGKSAGLGAIAGSSDTYWSRHKDRSMEGVLVKVTRVLIALFLLISIVLNIGSF
ncbi:MAG: preprotein translocase subunit SecG [Lachnospiraceae bacterium]|nr:preprotein translocase subunit SecG [Lachnospiraceae bacterium]